MLTPPDSDPPDDATADQPWVDRVHNLHDDHDLPVQVAANRRAAEAARRVIAGLAGTRIDAVSLDEAAAELERLAEILEPHQPTSRYDDTGGLHGGVTADPRIWESHPFLGPSHPFAPPLRVERVGDHAVATVTYGHVYEGPPGAVHGGMVAAAFDIVLGSAASMAQRAGLTGTLTVRYRRATPLYREIRYEGWIERIDERKTLVAGRSTVDDELLAEGEGIFVRVAERRFDPPTLVPPPASP